MTQFIADPKGRAGAGPPPPGVPPRQGTPYPQRKHIRIDHAAYAEPTAICAITIVALDRQPAVRRGGGGRAPALPFAWPGTGMTAAPTTSKLVSLREAAASVPDGATLALGGFVVARATAALARELVRQRRRGLTVSQAIVG